MKSVEKKIEMKRIEKKKGTKIDQGIKQECCHQCKFRRQC